MISVGRACNAVGPSHAGTIVGSATTIGSISWRRAAERRAPEDSALSPRDPSEIRTAFLTGEDRAVHEVEDWVSGLVRGGWRFRDPDAVVQEILLELVGLGRSGTIREDLDFRAYVRTVARHTCVDIHRRDRLRRTESIDDPYFETPADDDAPDPEERLAARRRRERLRYLMQGLAPACRSLLRWAYGDGLSSNEIADRLEIAPGAARVRLHRCLERARKLSREVFP